ncbi:UDP-2,3-diacylglucosamine diphosphatase [Fibrobacterota bacterium]
MKKKIYFVSDLHLGAEYDDAIPDRGEHFCRFIEQIEDRASHLMIMGDLFEFWMEYTHYIPKEYFQVLVSLHQLSRKGVEIHYFNGNHDFNLGSFFRKELGIHTHHKPQRLVLQGKSLHLLHGDGMARSDWKYRLVKSVLIHPFSNWCFRLIHPDWGMALAKFVGKSSRFHMNKKISGEYQEKSIRVLEKDIDIVVHGHTHLAFIKELKEGVYVNAGAWYQNLRYVEMADGRCSLKTYSKRKSANKLRL